MTKQHQQRALPCVALPYSPSLVGLLHETLAELEGEPAFAGATQRYWDICRGRIVAKATHRRAGGIRTRTRKKAGDAA